MICNLCGSEVRHLPACPRHPDYKNGKISYIERDASHDRADRGPAEFWVQLRYARAWQDKNPEADWTDALMHGIAEFTRALRAGEIKRA